MRHWLKRLIFILPTLIGISFICFALAQLAPGGPVEDVLASWRGSSGAEGNAGRSLVVTEEQRQRLIHYYGFDKPWHQRYWLWLGNVIQGDLGDSYYYDEPVKRVFARALPFSVGFGLFSFFITYALCVPLGIGKALKAHSLFDEFTSYCAFLLYAIPDFALGIGLIVFFGGGTYLNWFPIGGITSDSFEALTPWGKCQDVVRHLTLPLLCYVAGSFAPLIQLVKNAMIHELNQDYIRTAQAIGCNDRTVVFQAFRNAVIPIWAGVGERMASFITGALLIETIFDLRGIGRLSYEAVLHRDYPILLSSILCLSVIFIVGNLIVDIGLFFLDPRIRFE